MQKVCTLSLVFLLATLPVRVAAQFAPAAGKPGSTAIKGDSSCFVNWANSCSVKRGYRQINLPDSGYATVGNPQNATGMAMTGGVVSLGDSGVAILTFDPPIFDGDGYDFVVFENAFNDTFLELATVEISSDSVNWVAFPTTSLTQTAKQTAPFGGTKATEINNLAGKYRLPYGTPFDIREISFFSQINPENICFVRITDVIGSIDSNWGTRDHLGNIINDPFPTNFPSSGFDLDAVGVINQVFQSSTSNPSKSNTLKVYFHQQQLWVQGINIQASDEIQIISASGNSIKVKPQSFHSNGCIIPCELSAGWYQLQIITHNGHRHCAAFIAQP